MQQSKRENVFLVSVVIFSLLMLYGFAPIVSTAKATVSLESTKDTLSTSDTGSAATHTIVFDMVTGLTADQYVRVTFDAGFTGIVNGNVHCPANTTASTTGNVVDCVVNAASSLSAAAPQTISVDSVTNPSAEGPRDMTVATFQADDTEIESSGIKVFIIDNVAVSAHVNASLTFTIKPLSNTDTVNGIALTDDSATTSLSFGTLVSGERKVLGQELHVSTNASDGYIVTLQQSDDLKNSAGNTINSFNNSPDGTGSSTPQAWADPANKLDYDNTYGHMGVTTDDGGAGFDASEFVGLNGTDLLTVMSHNGPADGSTPGKGKASVAYAVQITDLQEAGDYSTTMTYVCTPTY